MWPYNEPSKAVTKNCKKAWPLSVGRKTKEVLPERFSTLGSQFGCSPLSYRLGLSNGFLLCVCVWSLNCSPLANSGALPHWCNKLVQCRLVGGTLKLYLLIFLVARIHIVFVMLENSSFFFFLLPLHVAAAWTVAYLGLGAFEGRI